MKRAVCCRPRKMQQLTSTIDIDQQKSAACIFHPSKSTVDAADARRHPFHSPFYHAGFKSPTLIISSWYQGLFAMELGVAKLNCELLGVGVYSLVRRGRHVCMSRLGAAPSVIKTLERNRIDICCLQKRQKSLLNHSNFFHCIPKKKLNQTIHKSFVLCYSFIEQSPLADSAFILWPFCTKEYVSFNSFLIAPSLNI